MVIFDLAELATAFNKKKNSPVIIRFFDKHISGSST